MEAYTQILPKRIFAGLPRDSLEPQIVIIFTLGSGSGKDSPRNQHVDTALKRKWLCNLACRLAHAGGAGFGHQKPGGDGQVSGLAQQVNICLLSSRLKTIT